MLNPGKTKRAARKAEQRAETQEMMLDAAEFLFAKHGLDGVTLKNVAQRVGVHPSLLNYYFADKEALFDTVFARRAVITNQHRMCALAAYDAGCANSPTVEGALEAFLESTLDLYIEGGDGWRNYAQLTAKVANTPEWAAELLELHVDPVVRRLIGLLQRALPQAALVEIFWGYHFVSGALMLTLARTGRIDKLSGGINQSEDFTAVKSRMASFMVAGFRAICNRPTAFAAPVELAPV
jgi:AcrR family transcriptional regulator